VKVLNLYAGIGGNRKLWDKVVDDLEVTAVEIDKKVAEVYAENFPEDEVVIGDAHSFLEDNYDGGWDFIWSSPPCPTHSKVRNVANVGSGQSRAVMPDMRLYEEVIFLQQIRNSSGCDFDGHYVVENVVPYYEPLIKPQRVHRHCFWASFYIPPKEIEKDRVHTWREAEKRYGFDLSSYKMGGKKKGTLLRNVVRPELGKHILECAISKRTKKLEAFA